MTEATQPTPVYHGTYPWCADAILRDGFTDAEGLRADGQRWSGVWVTSNAGSAREFGAAVIAINLDGATTAGIVEHLERWDEALIPAAALNGCSMRLVEDGARA